MTDQELRELKAKLKGMKTKEVLESILEVINNAKDKNEIEEYLENMIKAINIRK